MQALTNIELSLVIPVYNGSQSIKRVVEDAKQQFSGLRYEIILVNDGSRDKSEQVCTEIAQANPQIVRFVHLAKNFGEHNAVLSGMSRSTGDYVAVIDDDGQNPPSEVLRLFAKIKEGGHDVVYGHYKKKMHAVHRNLGSKFNDKMANVMLGKPPEIYLSSFKIMNRFIVDEVLKYRGPYPYIDGLIFRATSNITQIEVEHLGRAEGQSGYTLKKLIKLWLNMFLSFSIVPLRLGAVLGVFMAAISVFLIIMIVIDKLSNPAYPVGLPSVMVGIVFFAGMQLMILGMLGEYLGRLFLDHTGMPQYVVRYELRQGAKGK